MVTPSRPRLLAPCDIQSRECVAATDRFSYPTRNLDLPERLRIKGLLHDDLAPDPWFVASGRTRKKCEEYDADHRCRDGVLKSFHVGDPKERPVSFSTKDVVWSTVTIQASARKTVGRIPVDVRQ